MKEWALGLVGVAQLPHPHSLLLRLSISFTSHLANSTNHLQSNKIMPYSYHNSAHVNSVPSSMYWAPESCVSVCETE